MKESMLDVLIYLLEEYDGGQNYDNERDFLTDELVTAGFGSVEIGRAWGWLDDLAVQVEKRDHVVGYKQLSTRLFSTHEKSRLSFEAQRFLTVLQLSDLIDSATFELILDRLVALDCGSGELNMEQVRWVVFMVAFNHASDISEFVALEYLIFSDPTTDTH